VLRELKNRINKVFSNPILFGFWFSRAEGNSGGEKVTPLPFLSFCSIFSW
jgi:hypothetical protein